MIKETKNYDKLFWEYNYPVQLWKDDNGEVSYVILLPRKERCWNSDEDGEKIPKDEVNQFIDNSIEKFKTAIELFEKFKKGEIDHVYYWDKPKTEV